MKFEQQNLGWWLELCSVWSYLPDKERLSLLVFCCHTDLTNSVQAVIIVFCCLTIHVLRRGLPPGTGSEDECRVIL